jgi:transmembrane sensor
MNELQFKELIDRYLAGTASEEEIEQLNTLEQLFPAPESQTGFNDSEKHKILKKRIFSSITRQISGKKSFRWLGVAAAVAALIVIVCLPKATTFNNNNLIAYNQVKTPSGKIKEVHLSDGTVVILNAGSTLWYPAQFQDSIREVKLVGQAFFKVKHNDHQPFLVYAGALTTRVLGTSFDVYAYPESRSIRITLATGRIHITKQKVSLATLTPNKQLVFNKAKSNTETLVVNSQDYTSWKTGQQLFKQSRLDEVALYINKWYGLTIAFNHESLKNYKITTRFTTDMSAKQVLDIIAASSCAQYTIHNQRVVYSGQGCRIHTKMITPKPNAM